MGKESIQGIVLSIIEEGLTIQDMTPFLMETDYLDDPRRPGAVLGPKTLPKRTNELGRHLQMPISEGGLGWDRSAVADLLWMLHRVWPDTLYGDVGDCLPNRRQRSYGFGAPCGEIGGCRSIPCWN